MKTIIVPTDFTECAGNAIGYAKELAIREKCNIILCHSLEPDCKEILYSLVVPASKSYRQAAIQKLNEEILKIEMDNKVKADYFISKKNLAETILSIAEEKNSDFIIMGTRGAGGLKKIFSGTNTSKILEKAQCPIFVIPEAARYNGINRITYCTDYHKADHATLKKLVAFAKPLGASINVLHFHRGNDQEKEKKKMREFIYEINGALNYENISYQVLMVKDSFAKFEEYLDSYATDLLAMATSQRSLLDKLVSGSETKELSYHSKIPLMVFHHSKKVFVL